MKSVLAFAAVVFASATLSAAVVTGGTTTTTTTTTTNTTVKPPVVAPKPPVGTCQKPATQPAIKPIEVKCEKKEAQKPAPIKSAAPSCAKK